jgi:hypothetical protein
MYHYAELQMTVNQDDHQIEETKEQKSSPQFKKRLVTAKLRALEEIARVDNYSCIEELEANNRWTDMLAKDENDLLCVVKMYDLS